MHSEASARVQEIRSKVVAERALISALDGQIKDSYLKKMLQRASLWLGDVEGFLIPHVLQARTSHDSSMWLSCAELTLQNAVQQRQAVQDIVAKYGPNIQSMPGS